MICHKSTSWTAFVSVRAHWWAHRVCCRLAVELSPQSSCGRLHTSDVPRVRVLIFKGQLCHLLTYVTSSQWLNSLAPVLSTKIETVMLDNLIRLLQRSIRVYLTHGQQVNHYFYSLWHLLLLLMERKLSRFLVKVRQLFQRQSGKWLEEANRDQDTSPQLFLCRIEWKTNVGSRGRWTLHIPWLSFLAASWLWGHHLIVLSLRHIRGLRVIMSTELNIVHVEYFVLHRWELFIGVEKGIKVS